jgi:hypothetical protein
LLQRLYFNHVPRTAGTSLRLWLESHFEPPQVCPHVLPGEFSAAPPTELEGYLLFAGHLQSLPHELFKQEIETFTVLREPRSHFSSLLSYFAKCYLCPPDSPDAEIRAQAKAVLFEHIDKAYAPKWSAINQQTKWLNGLGGDPHRQEKVEADDRMVEAASTYLDSCLMVGTTDRLQDVADVLCYHRRWPHTPFERRDNDTPSRGLLEGVSDQILDHLLRFDRHLYTKADRQLTSAVEECFGANANAKDRARVLDERAARSPDGAFSGRA